PRVALSNRSPTPLPATSRHYATSCARGNPLEPRAAAVYPTISPLQTLRVRKASGSTDMMAGPAREGGMGGKNVSVRFPCNRSPREQVCYTRPNHNKGTLMVQQSLHAIKL